MIILKRGSSLVILYFAGEGACIDSYRSESKRNPFLYCTVDYSLSPCLQYCVKGMQTNFGETVANFVLAKYLRNFEDFPDVYCLRFGENSHCLATKCRESSQLRTKYHSNFRLPKIRLRLRKIHLDTFFVLSYRYFCCRFSISLLTNCKSQCTSTCC